MHPPPTISVSPMSGSITLRRYIKLYEPQFLLCTVNSPKWYSMCIWSVPVLALGLQQWIGLKRHLPLQALHCEVIKRLKWGENIPQCHLSALYVISCHCLWEKCERIWRCFLGKSKDEEILELIYMYIYMKAAHTGVEGTGSGASSPSSKSQLCPFELCDLKQQNGDSNTTHTYYMSNKCPGGS